MDKIPYFRVFPLFGGMIGHMNLLNFVGYCDLASFKKVHTENKKLRPENIGQPKSAKAFVV